MKSIINFPVERAKKSERTFHKEEFNVVSFYLINKKKPRNLKKKSIFSVSNVRNRRLYASGSSYLLTRKHKKKYFQVRLFGKGSKEI